jgi:hypothetical protein
VLRMEFATDVLFREATKTSGETDVGVRINPGGIPPTRNHTRTRRVSFSFHIPFTHHRISPLPLALWGVAEAGSGLP